MNKIYVDSCIYISLVTNEFNHFNKLKGQNYYDLFELFYQKKYKLVISTHVISEIKKFFKKRNSENDFNFILKLINDLKQLNNIEIINYDKNDKIKANELDSKNFADALHVILAIKSNCILITTENLSDFLKYENLIEIKHPKELLE